jgi:tetratricopeptide (TPR) repeat protein
MTQRLHFRVILIGALCAVAVPVSVHAQQKPSDADVSFNEVESLIQQHRFDEARAATLAELQSHPKSVEGYNLVGIIAADQQDYSGAVTAFKKALQISPNSVKTHNNLGDIYVARKDFDFAESEFKTVLRLDPSNRDGNYNLGVLLMMKGNAAAAITHFERVRPQNTATRFNLIRAYFEAKRPQDAIRLANELSAQSASDVQVHFSLGILLASQKQYKEAAIELQKADALKPGTFEILFNLGQVYLRDAQYAKADLSLNRALALKPDSVETMYMLARAYRGESRPLDALDLLIRAHKAAPDNVDVILLMAHLSMSQSYFEDAIPLLQSGLEIAPQRPDLLAALGESFFMAGQIDKAIEEFKKLLEVDRSARSYSFLGLSYRNLGRFDEAKQYFEQGLKLDPHHSTCLFNMGYIAEQQGDNATAESYFQQALRADPDYADPLLELANVCVVTKKPQEAVDLLRRFVKVSHDPATGYYKLAMVERDLHQRDAAERDLNFFKNLSRNASTGPYPYQHLFDYLDNRSALSAGARDQLDLNELQAEVKRHPDRSEDLYLLAEAYLKAGNIDDARAVVSQLDQLSVGDFRTLTGVGVLLARYRHYDDAIQHFQLALQANPSSDDVRFDLANAYFRKRMYPQALDTAQQISPAGRDDEAYLTLLGDIYAHMGDTAQATQIFEDAIRRNPDNDQPYLSLALLSLRAGNVADARKILLKGQQRIPGSGKLYWGLGLTAALEGKSTEAAQQLERAVDLLPEWPGAYSTLGVFYFETGQIAKAREVLDRFRNGSANGALDIDRIEQVLDSASSNPPADNKPTELADKSQFLQLALSLADRTL